MPDEEDASAQVDRYIAAFPPEVRALLRKVRTTIRKAAPHATEVISYRMPAFKGRGMLVYYAAFKHHIGMYPPVRGNASLIKAAKKYAGPKGNLQFPLDKPIPYPLIARIMKLRIKQDAAKESRSKK